MNIKYNLEIYGIWHTPYINSNQKNIDEQNAQKVMYSSNICYGDLDSKTFLEILETELDVVKYSLTAKNIKKEFGYSDTNIISDACIKRIIKYYKFRKDLYNKISKEILITIKNLIKKTNLSEIALKYDIPADCNNFSCEDPDYTGGQKDAWIKITCYCNK